uniref:Uncharacterized protein n=1 Tax=Chloracidobacterium thermophilum TaxID=458033 RepID=A8DJD6_9BACT|nr:hypothetical protein YS_M60-F11.029 [Chloracidobacterium thermophilum]
MLNVLFSPFSGRQTYTYELQFHFPRQVANHGARHQPPTP